MSVFLRWGVFGILAVAALLYAYNASKRLAENRDAGTPRALAATQAEVVGDAGDAGDAAVDSGDSGEGTGLGGRCGIELMVADRALQARRDAQPLDRLLRMQVIAFESDPAVRARLEQVATRWYRFEGDEPSAAMLAREVAAHCEDVTPAP